MTFVLPTLQERPGSWGPPTEGSGIDGQRAAGIDRSTHKWSNLESQSSEWWTTVNINQKTVADLMEDAPASTFIPKGRHDNKKHNNNNNDRQHGSKGGKKGKNKTNRPPRAEIVSMEDSFKLIENHERLTDFFLDDLAKQSKSFDVTLAVTELKLCGLPQVYASDIDATRLSIPRPLTNNDSIISLPNAFDDSTMRALLKSIDGTWPVVVATDDVLSSLMACTRSHYAWHVQCFRFKRFTFLNHVPHGRTDVEWVAETNTMTGPSESDTTSANRISKLGAESTLASFRFRQQCLQKTTCPMKTEKRSDDLSGMKSMFRYRRYDIGEGASKYTLVVRSEIDAAVKNPDKKGEFLFLRIFGLLEHLPSQGTDRQWSSLESNPAAILMSELKQNNFKMARWIAKSVLSGAHLMKIGFIARDEKSGHKVMRVMSQDPQALGNQTGITTAQLWSNAHNILSKMVRVTNERMGVTYDAKSDLFSTTYAIPNYTTFLVKFINEARLELIQQEDDGHKQAESSSDEESSDDSGDDSDGSEESGSD